jgi:hypothetical protein
LTKLFETNNSSSLPYLLFRFEPSNMQEPPDLGCHHHQPQPSSSASIWTKN